MELRRLHRLLELNRKIAVELEPERVLTAILDSAVEFVEAERGFLVTVEDNRLYIPVARDFWRKDIPSPAFEVSRSVALEVVRRGESVITEDASRDERFEEMVSVHDLKIRSVLCVPPHQPEEDDRRHLPRQPVQSRQLHGGRHGRDRSVRRPGRDLGSSTAASSRSSARSRRSGGGRSAKSS